MAFWKDEAHIEKKEHRDGPDLMMKWIRLASFVCWFLFFLTILIWDSARPQLYTILDAKYGKLARTIWDSEDLFLAFILSIVTFVFTVISLLINTQRLKRKTDHISISLFVCMIVSGILMIGFFMYTIGIF